MRHTLRGLTLLACLTAFSGTVWAATQEMLPGDVVANRQRLMKLMAASWADIQAKAKAGNIEAIVVNAETIAVSSYHIPALFPAGSASDQAPPSPRSGSASTSSRPPRGT